jgi:hypothetical protein
MVARLDHVGRRAARRAIRVEEKTTSKGDGTMKIGFFKVLGLVGMLAEELSAAAADGKVTVKDALRIVERICDALGIEFIAELED